MSLLGILCKLQCWSFLEDHCTCPLDKLRTILGNPQKICPTDNQVVPSTLANEKNILDLVGRMWLCQRTVGTCQCHRLGTQGYRPNAPSQPDPFPPLFSLPNKACIHESPLFQFRPKMYRLDTTCSRLLSWQPPRANISPPGNVHNPQKNYPLQNPNMSPWHTAHIRFLAQGPKKWGTHCCSILWHTVNKHCFPQTCQSR